MSQSRYAYKFSCPSMPCLASVELCVCLVIDDPRTDEVLIVSGLLGSYDMINGLLLFY